LDNNQNIVIAFNNHFAGYGPQSANTFLKLMNKLGNNDWTKDLERERHNSANIERKYQTSLSDYTYFKNML
jgi:hypothetical protein